MPADPSVYSLIRPVSINTPFENLSQMLTVRNQQEANRALVDQRKAQTQRTQQEADEKRRAAEAAAQVRSLFSRVDPATQQPVAPQLEELASIIGPQGATDVFKGFEALRTAKSGNAIKDTERVAQVLGGVEAMPGDLRGHAYEGALQQLIADGTMKPGQAPPKYDANFVKAKRREALSVVEQFKQEQPIEVSAGASLMSPGGQVIGTAPASATANKPSSVQEYEYAKTQGFKGSFEDYQNADANRKQRAASERAPYFTYQPVFDPSGKPISAIRFDARGGPPQVVDVSALTGGGQLKPPPGDTGKQAIANEVSTVQLDRLTDLFNSGGKAFTGPLAGRWEDIRQRTPGFKVNKTYANFKAATDAFKNSVIKAVTGAAMSEPEAKRIIGQIPTETDKPEVWTAKAEQTRKNLADLAVVLAKKQGGTGAKDPMGIR
jgi:hypothetical protein